MIKCIKCGYVYNRETVNAKVVLRIIEPAGISTYICEDCIAESAHIKDANARADFLKSIGVK